MSLSVSYVVLTAKQREIEALKRLKSRAGLVAELGRMIHALQNERGASSIYLASAGKRFTDNRKAIINESLAIAERLREVFDDELGNPAFTDPKVIALMAWVLLGIDALPGLRRRIDELDISGSESVAAFSRLVAGLISLVFELVHISVAPEISRLLVALFNLVDGKEHAGQERAIGALAFGAGHFDDAMQHRLQHLQQAQGHCFNTFCEFADDQLNARWQQLEDAPFSAQLQALREKIDNSRPGESLDTGLSDAWFDASSARIETLWAIQNTLVEALQARCASLVKEAENELLDSDGLLAALRSKPPTRAEVIGRFFDPDLPIEEALSFRASTSTVDRHDDALLELLQSQTQRLVDVENELATAKRALDERKLVDRAKRMLMERFGLDEAEAYARLRSASMDRNLRLAQVAESVLDNA